MNYGAIKPVDIADGIGCRVGLYVSGCTRHCPGCHNQESWDFHHGKIYDVFAYTQIMELLSTYPDALTQLNVIPDKQKIMQYRGVRYCMTEL